MTIRSSEHGEDRFKRRLKLIEETDGYGTRWYIKEWNVHLGWFRVGRIHRTKKAAVTAFKKAAKPTTHKTLMMAVMPDE